MANVTTSSKIFVDTTGQVRSISTKVSYILFTPANAGDSLDLREVSGGSACLFLQAAVADNTQIFDFSIKPILFSQGLYIHAITAGAKATIVFTSEGT